MLYGVSVGLFSGGSKWNLGDRKLAIIRKRNKFEKTLFKNDVTNILKISCKLI